VTLTFDLVLTLNVCSISVSRWKLYQIWANRTIYDWVISGTRFSSAADRPSIKCIPEIRS